MAPSPSSSPVQVGTLFLGGGNAAGYFAAEYDKIISADPSLKDSAFGGSLTVVSGERSVSYERPALSKAYLAPKGPARLPGFHSCVGGGGERQEASWYEARGIEYRLGSEATEVDAASRTVTLADGSVLGYKKLVIATGCRPVDLAKDFKMPGAEEGGGGNVFYLRDVADADRLYSALEKAAASSGSGSDSGARPLVIGGGYIGEERRERDGEREREEEEKRERERRERWRGRERRERERETFFSSLSHDPRPPPPPQKKKLSLGLELAAALAGWGLEPVVAFPEDRILARILTPDAAAFYAKFYELKGAELRPGTTVKALEKKEGGDAVSAAVLSDGTSLSVSLVVVGVGARPRTELFGESGGGGGGSGPGAIAVVGGAPGGVLVDARLRSVSADDVWACGDVAAFPSGCLFGGRKGEEEGPTRQEHVQHARSSAAFVARDIVARSSSSPSSPSYAYLPYYYSRVFDLGWVFYGSSSPGSTESVEFGERDAEAAAVRGEKKQTFGSFHLEVDDEKRERRVVGAFLEGGSPEQNAAVKKLVEARAVVEEGSALGIEWASAKAAKL